MSIITYKRIRTMYTKSILILSLCFYFSNGCYIKRCHNLTKRHSPRVPEKSSFDILEEKISQPVNHFNKHDTRKWDMRYFQNFNKWHRGGPVYIFISGESTAAAVKSVLKKGLMYELAEETKGAMFVTEHRYYGKSIPFKTVTRDNIKFLNAEQALADIANFIRLKIKTEERYKNSKIVVIGGSYAGNLAAWMRLHYRDLVDAAIASSAPVLAKLDIKEFLETVSEDFKKHTPPECFNHIKNTFESYKRDLKTPGGRKKLMKEQNICATSDLSKKENQAEFFDERIDDLVNRAQEKTSKTLKDDCMKPTIFCKKSVEEGCCNIEFDKIYPARTSQEPINEKDFWTYQKCNEFGFAFTAPKNEPLSGIMLDVDYSVKICCRLFGTEYTKEYIEERIKKTNEKNGGLTPDVTKVVFVHGEMDPWKKLGVQKKLSNEVPVLKIEGASHCNDLYSNEALTTTDKVKKVKIMEKALIKKWIGYDTRISNKHN